MAQQFASALRRALTNITVHGDTDVFPFPFEKHFFEDRIDDCVEHLECWHKDFGHAIASHEPFAVDALSQVGYTGFRQVTAIEPFWNAYYLALVLSLAKDIESLRVPTIEDTVFSYRYEPAADQSSVFQGVTWNDYRKRAVELAKEYEYVVLTDISDFYARVNHHRLDNAFEPITTAGDTPTRILRLLSTFSHRQSYGLPVGGPASRILAELSLVDVDRHLRNTGPVYCRYADDFTLFCSSRSESLKALVDLSEILALEGLSLQKHKTRIMPRGEFLQMHSHLDPSARGTMEQKLLGLSLKYDPYSATPEEDYLALKASVEDIDVIGILSSEVAKTAIDQTLTRQALNALRALDVPERETALSILLAPENLDVLSPVFPHLMRMVRGNYDEIGTCAKDIVDENLLALIDKGSHLLSIEINRLYLVQVLARRHSDSKEKALVAMFGDNPDSLLLRRMVILALANWNCGYFVKKELRHFASASPWERRALIVSSYRLGDQGKHWRRRARHAFNQVEGLLDDWACDRKQAGQLVPV